jgi:hypothetical protein
LYLSASVITQFNWFLLSYSKSALGTPLTFGGLLREARPTHILFFMNSALGKNCPSIRCAPQAHHQPAGFDCYQAAKQ